MLKTIRHLLEMIRFSHTLFALPFALLAAVMAWTVRADEQLAAGNYQEILRLRGMPFPKMDALLSAIRWKELAGILVCMVAARSAAMAFNRLTDRMIDANNPRTKGRHLPAGILSLTSVIVFTAVSSLVFIAGTLLFLPNRWPIILSVPVLLLLLGYSLAKRFTTLAHFWLGAALMLAPVSVWIALRGQVLADNPSDIFPALILGSAVLAWVSGFDMIYACQDAEFDRQARLHSIPAAIGVVGALRLAAACHVVTLLLLAVLPLVCPQVPLGWPYGLSIAAVAGLLTYEHLLVRPDDLTRVNVAFFHVNAIISIGLFVVGTLDLLT